MNCAHGDDNIRAFAILYAASSRLILVACIDEPTSARLVLELPRLVVGFELLRRTCPALKVNKVK